MWTSAAQLETNRFPWQEPRGDEPRPVAPDALRARAVAADASSTRKADLAGVWGELVLGHWLVVEMFFAADRSFLVIKDVRSLARKGVVQGGLRRRQLALLEPVLLGKTQKAVALEAGLCVSSVSTGLKSALGVLGITCPASRVPPVIVALVSAARSSTRASGRESVITDGGQRYRVISIERPDLALSSLLSRSEYDAIRRLVEGKHHDEIAEERRASPRTVANQIGSAFRKLGVSGRSELLAALVRGDVPALRLEFGADVTSA